MTISYGQQVATSSGLGVFWKLLFLWRGSIYKLVWANLSVYIVLYYSLSLTYRFILDVDGREKFEQLSLHCQKYADLIPVTFVLGFYVSIVITRWWAQYKTIPWPDSCCLFISTCILGHDDRGRLMRRTIARYLILALIQALRMTSIQVKKRFPTLSHLKEAGIITDSELKIIESVDEKCIQHPKYWMSLVWAGAVVTRAKKEGRIKDDFAFRTIIKEINKFRSGCGGLLDYDWISIPLVYTQVVTLAVYTFFLSSLMGRQFLDTEKNYEGHDVDLYVPVFTFLQFFFYMGWLKVAEVLINPFGEDDDDFEMNWLIDRNLQVAYLIVDEMHAEHPELVKDQFWDEGIPDELPYTIAAEEFRQADPWQGSTAEVEVTEEQSEFVYLDKIEEESDGDKEADVDDDDVGVNLKEVLVEEICKEATKPMLVGNGKLKSFQHSIASNLGGLGVRRNESSASVLGLIRRVFTGPESGSRLNIAGMGSDHGSVSSRTGSVAMVGNGGGNKRAKRLRRKKSRPGYHRSISNASPLSNQSQAMSRVNTHEHAIFKMSDTSSVNSLNSEPELLSRTNSEATALSEVREILRQDLERRQSSHDGDGEEREFKGFRSLRQRRKDELRLKSEHNVTMMKKKLEQVQALQTQIMKAIDSEIKRSESKDLDVDMEDAIQLLEQKTVELKKTYRKASGHGLGSCDMSELETTCASSPHHDTLETRDPRTWRSRHSSFNHDPNYLASDKIIRGVVITPTPGSPTPRTDQDAFESASKTTQIPQVGLLGTDEVFDMNLVRQAEEEENEVSLDESEPQSVVENLVSGEIKQDAIMLEPVKDFEESWDNLGTIEEQPELGYQSDSSDTTELLRTEKKKLKVTPGGNDIPQTLPTVQEEK